MLLVVLWRLRYKLSLRDLAEMFLERGFVFTHETVREWEARFAPLLTARLRAKRRGQGGTKWHADETYVRVDGRWRYRYRAIDREGNLVDALLSERRDMDAAQRFFAQAVDVVGHAPEQVTTDGHDAYPRAIRETLGDGVTHCMSRYKNNRIEQDHRGIKQRYYPMRGGSLALCWGEQTHGRPGARNGWPVRKSGHPPVRMSRWCRWNAVRVLGHMAYPSTTQQNPTVSSPAGVASLGDRRW